MAEQRPHRRRTEHELLIQIERDVRRLNRKVDRIMAAQDDLNTAVQGITDGVSQLGTDVQAVEDALKALEANGVDVTGAVAALNTAKDTLGQIDQGAKDAVAATPPAP